MPLYSGTSRFIACHGAIYTEDYTKIALYSGCAKPLSSLRFSCGLETANGRIKEEQFNVVLGTNDQLVLHEDTPLIEGFLYILGFYSENLSCPLIVKDAVLDNIKERIINAN